MSDDIERQARWNEIQQAYPCPSCGAKAGNACAAEGGKIHLARVGMSMGFEKPGAFAQHLSARALQKVRTRTLKRRSAR